MIYIPVPAFEHIYLRIMGLLKDAPAVNVGEWQARVGVGEGHTIELEDVAFEFPIPEGKLQLIGVVQPNLPWAEDHFQERVSGRPLNPPPSNEWWPHNVRGNEGHKKNEVFSHTYPERMWPKYAPHPGQQAMNVGIRYTLGDLGDLVRLFQSRPDTRQGYLPIWFPEDVTASNEGERVPCTLGYHMMQRHGRLSIRYYMRSCDFVRHFKDDVYMAARLVQWVCEQVGLGWVPGDLVMYISSLHAFSTDRPRLEATYNEEYSKRLNRVLTGY